MRILLIGGWGMPATVLAPLRMALGLAPEHCFILDRPWDKLVAQVTEALQPGTFLIGWSLGGNLAMEVACRAPDRVYGLMTLASNPRFTQTDSWLQAYDPVRFQAFQQALAENPQATLERFAGLATLGSALAREEVRWLREHVQSAPTIPKAVLEETLACLACIDQRELWRRCELPLFALLGEQDHLVPAAVAQDLRELNPAARVEVLPGMAHLPSGRFNAQVAERIREAVLPILKGWC